MAAAEAAGAALHRPPRRGQGRDLVSPRALLRLPGQPDPAELPRGARAGRSSSRADRDGTGHEPPEVLTSGEWTPVGDVYALASTLWHLLAGTPPTSGTQEERLAKLHAAEQPTLSRPDVPRARAGRADRGAGRRPRGPPDGRRRVGGNCSPGALRNRCPSTRPSRRTSPHTCRAVRSAATTGSRNASARAAAASSTAPGESRTAPSSRRSSSASSAPRTAWRSARFLGERHHGPQARAPAPGEGPRPDHRGRRHGHRDGLRRRPRPAQADQESGARPGGPAAAARSGGRRTLDPRTPPTWCTATSSRRTCWCAEPGTKAGALTDFGLAKGPDLPTILHQFRAAGDPPTWRRSWCTAGESAPPATCTRSG